MAEEHAIEQTPPFGARCAVHPETEALLTCPRCGDYACGACVRVASGRLCATCRTREQEAIRPMSLVDLFFGFRGRISRSRYWIGMLSIWFGVFFIAMIVAIVTRTAGEPSGGPAEVVTALLVLGLAWPWCALHVKRWHDRDKSGLWLLVSLVPLIGGPWTFVECGCLSGTAGPNRYGADPLGRNS